MTNHESKSPLSEDDQSHIDTFVGSHGGITPSPHTPRYGSKIPDGETPSPHSDIDEEYLPDVPTDQLHTHFAPRDQITLLPGDLLNPQTRAYYSLTSISQLPNGNPTILGRDGHIKFQHSPAFNHLSRDHAHIFYSHLPNIHKLTCYPNNETYFNGFLVPGPHASQSHPLLFKTGPAAIITMGRKGGAGFVNMILGTAADRPQELIIGPYKHETPIAQLDHTQAIIEPLKRYAAARAAATIISSAVRHLELRNPKTQSNRLFNSLWKGSPFVLPSTKLDKRIAELLSKQLSRDPIVSQVSIVTEFNGELIITPRQSLF